MKPEVYVGLIHWPVLDRAGGRVATNVTNFDVHDIARACRTYGVQRYYIINRMQEQLMYVHRVLEHWQVGGGVKFNPMRRTALKPVRTAETLEAALRELPQNVKTVATAARDNVGSRPVVSFSELRGDLAKRPLFLLFGTGFGLAPEVLEAVEVYLEPIRGSSEDDYRHLSVRSAVSICLDRLLAR